MLDPERLGDAGRDLLGIAEPLKNVIVPEESIRILKFRRSKNRRTLNKHGFFQRKASEPLNFDDLGIAEP